MEQTAEYFDKFIDEEREEFQVDAEAVFEDKGGDIS